MSDHRVRFAQKIILLNDKNEVLVTYFGDTVMPERFVGTADFPGGGLEEGESPEEGLRREVTEELGGDIEFVIEQPLFVTDWIMEKSEDRAQCICLFYLARLTSGELILSEEHGEMEWVAADALADLKWEGWGKRDIGRLVESIKSCL